MSEPSKDRVPPERTPKRRRSSGVQAIGGVIAGFDYQVFRATKPPAELVEGARPVRGVSGEDGSILTIDFPEDDPADPEVDGSST